MPVINRHVDPVPEGAIQITRPYRWGNPIRLGPGQPRGSVLRRYHAWLRGEVLSGRIRIMDLAGLHGTTLACVCHPKPCHGHILQAFAAWAALPDAERPADPPAFEDIPEMWPLLAPDADQDRVSLIPRF